MSTCKDCLHYEPCYHFGYILDPIHGGVICDSFKPTADMVEVKHGKWIEHHGQSYLVHPMKYDEYGPILQDYVSYECSECGRTESKKEPYCHCGAKMDGKEDEGK